MLKKKNYLAVGGGVDHYDLLGKEPVEQWNQIQKYLSTEWEAGDQTRLFAINGCLEKLSTSLF